MAPKTALPIWLQLDPTIRVTDPPPEIGEGEHETARHRRFARWRGILAARRARPRFCRLSGPVRSFDEIKAAFSPHSPRVGAILLYNSPLLRNNLAAVVDLAIAAKMPVMTIWRDYTKRHFLVSYGLDVPDLWRRLGAYAAKILRGASPSELPVEMPARFTLAINLKPANALGLTVPQSLPARADEVIE